MQQSGITEVLPRVRHTAALAVLVLVVSLIASGGVWGDGVFASEASKFLELQRENYNSMLTGQRRLKRACSVPLAPQSRRPSRLPSLTALSRQLVPESERFKTRARDRHNDASREKTTLCRNPVGRVLELFGAESSCTIASQNEASARAVLDVAVAWESLLVTATGPQRRRRVRETILPEPRVYPKAD